MRRFCLAVVFLVIAQSIVVFAQMTIDATGPIRERKRQATTGGGGSVGRKLPLRVSVEVRYPSPDVNGKTVLQFTLTNLGKERLEIPTSPNPGDLELDASEVTYRGTTLGLSINLVRDGKTEGLSGGVVLFGSPEFTGTLVPLAPGGSIRVLAKVLLPPNPAARFVVYAGLSRETIKTVGGHTSSDTQEIGYATSQPYTVRALFGAAH